MLYYEFYKSFKKTFFDRTLPVTASVCSKQFPYSPNFMESYLIDFIIFIICFNDKGSISSINPIFDMQINMLMERRCILAVKQH